MVEIWFEFGSIWFEFGPSLFEFDLINFNS